MEIMMVKDILYFALVLLAETLFVNLLSVSLFKTRINRGGIIACAISSVLVVHYWPLTLFA
jgi:hypothetical protein